MDFTGEMLRDTAGRLFRQHVDPPVLRTAEAGNWPDALWTAIEEAGLTRALLPEGAGGYGINPVDALNLLRVAGEHAAPVPLAETMLAGWLLAGAGLTVPDGPLTFAPVADAALALSRSNGVWCLTGTATRMPWGRRAVAAAVLAEHDGARHVALLRPPWQVEPGENLAREPRDRVTFDAVPEAVAATTTTPLQLRALGAAMRTQQIAGALAAMLEMTERYAQERVQFGRPIGRFQAVQQNVAVLAAQVVAAAAAADLAAEAAADGLRVLPIAAAKSRAGEAAGISAAIAHQVHGAIGFTHEHRLHFFTKRLWSWRDEFGNETEWNRWVGAQVAAVGADRVWQEITAA